MPGSSDLMDLYRHDGWANEKVFAICADLDAELLDQPAPGTYGTVRKTLVHLASIADVYWCLLEGRPLESLGERESFLGQDLTWFRRRLAELAPAFVAWIERADGAALAAPLPIPWFDFPVSAREGLLQVLTHSSHHRSQVLSFLGASGVEVPDLDYVLMVRERQGG